MSDDCRLCGGDVFAAARRGAYLTRTNPKGEIGIMECSPSCDQNHGDASSALIGAIDHETGNSPAAWTKVEVSHDPDFLEYERNVEGARLSIWFSGSGDWCAAVTKSNGDRRRLAMSECNDAEEAMQESFKIIHSETYIQKHNHA